MIELRPYQIDAIAALERGFAKGEQRLGVSAPTGVGKTIIMAVLAHRWSRQRVLILVHRDELAEQTVDKLRKVDRQLSVGVVKARRNEGGAAVVVASIQTLGRKGKDGQLRRLAQIGRFGLVICDEAHRSMAPQWQDVLTMLGAFADDGPRVAGFSATWVRSDKVGLGDFWQRICYRLSISWAIRNHYLVEPHGKAVLTDLDLSEVKMSGGDYNQSDLGHAVTEDSIAEAIVRAYAEHAADRSGALFAPTVKSAEYFAEHLNAAGFRTECVFGTTPIETRRNIYRRSRTGATQIIASCGVISEGFDAPWISAGVLARPTRHVGLFIQQVGRCIRPCPEIGKQDAIILDLVGATDEHHLDWWCELTTSTPKPPRAYDDEDDEAADALTDIDEDLDDLRSTEEIRIARMAKVLGFEDRSLFGSQKAMWHRTAAGVMFVDAGSTFVFVEPQPGSDTHWRIGECPRRTMAGGRWVDEWVIDQAAAMDQAGDYAIAKSESTASRTSRRRKDGDRRHGSPNQIAYAGSLGIKDPSSLTATQLSDAITYVIGSRVLAPVRYQHELETSQ